MQHMQHEFQSTRWSVVVAAGRVSSPEGQRALASLCELYWPPLYAYARRRMPDVHEAQDLTQGFFAELLEKNYVGAANADRGKFRAFLLTAFKHFLSRQWDKQKAQKRGSGRSPISLDFESADSRLDFDVAAGLTAEQYYDQQWVIALLDTILCRLQSEFEQAGKSNPFLQLKAFIIGDHSETTYAHVADKLGMTESAARKAVSRLRQRYRELLREEIAQTVCGPDEIEDEIRNLFVTLDL